MTPPSLLLLLLLWSLDCASSVDRVTVADDVGLPSPHSLRVEYLRQPLGVEIQRSPRFSWRLAHPADGAGNVSQSAFELVVCPVVFGRAPSPPACYGSGRRVNSSTSVNVEAPGLPLVEDALYRWRVRWWATGRQEPSPFSPYASFGTELKRGWASSGSAFIGGNYSSNQLRTEFQLASNASRVGRAVLYIVGLGNNRVSLSGTPVGSVFRSPPTQFAERLLYDVHDVTSILQQGGIGCRHALGVSLGHARYADQRSPSTPDRCTGGQTTCDMVLRLVLSIVFVDGSVQKVVSAPGVDGGWLVTAGPTTHDDSYAGEILDARKATPGWALPGYHVGTATGAPPGAPPRWRPAEAVAVPSGAVLSSYLMPPVAAVESYTAIRFWQPQHNEFSFDFGQNVAGVLSLPIPEGCAPGTRITVTHGEAVHQPQRENGGPGRVFHLYDCGADGNGCTGFMSYICNGKESSEDGTNLWTPQFFTSGGRYVKIEGYPGPLARESLRLSGVRVDVEYTGMLSTSNDRLNEVTRIGRGSVLGNLAFGFPSDCPTRYTVFLRTINDAQRFHGMGSGNMPDYSPAFGNGLTSVSGLPADLADPGWAAAYCLLVEYIHTHYADDRIWQDHYQPVARYLDFVVANATDADGLFTYSRFGDWCAFKWLPHTLENSGMGGCYGISPLSSSFFYARQLEILQRAAGRLGLPQDQVKWARLLTDVTAAFRKAFMQPDGLFSDNANGAGTQAVMGSLALALAYPKSANLLSNAERAVINQALVRNIAAHGNHPYSGELSLTYLFDGLAEAGRSDLVVAMASNPSQPGWGYMVEQGATTMYESWYTDRYSSIGTRFHDMFVGPFVFFYRGLAGLAMKENTTGWKELRIAPQAYDFWSGAATPWTPPAHVGVLSAVWGRNCVNRSSHQDLTAAMKLACSGKVQCAFQIPNNTDCADQNMPLPPPSPLPPPPPPPPTCKAAGCHMLPLPPDSFFVGIWHTNFINITTESACVAACLASPKCQQVTWLKRPSMPCSEYVSLQGGWPPPARIGGVSAFVKCFANETEPQQCNRNLPPPPPPPPPLPIRRKVFNVSYSCGANHPARYLSLGPDKGVNVHGDSPSRGDLGGITFTEAGGRTMHVDCRPRAEALHFVNAEVMTYQGRLASSWRVFPRVGASSEQRHGASLCGSVDVNTYGGGPAALNLTCTQGVITSVEFASYGRPTGTCGNFSVLDSCHHPNSTDVVRELCVGKRSCVVEATQTQFGGKDPCPRSGLKLNTGPHRLAVAVTGCDSAPIFELNVTVPVGARADVVLPTQALGVDVAKPSTRVADGSGLEVPTTRDSADNSGDLVVNNLGSGAHTFVLSSGI